MNDSQILLVFTLKLSVLAMGTMLILTFPPSTNDPAEIAIALWMAVLLVWATTELINN